MQEISFASPGTTDAPRAGLGTSPIKPLGPKPAPPVQALTARPLPHDLHIPSAPYGPVSVTRAELDQQMADAGIRPVGIGEPAAWGAFRDAPIGGAR